MSGDRLCKCGKRIVEPARCLNGHAQPDAALYERLAEVVAEKIDYDVLADQVARRLEAFVAGLAARVPDERRLVDAGEIARIPGCPGGGRTITLTSSGRSGRAPARAAASLRPGGRAGEARRPGGTRGERRTACKAGSASPAAGGGRPAAGEGTLDMRAFASFHGIQTPLRCPNDRRKVAATGKAAPAGGVNADRGLDTRGVSSHAHGGS